MHCRTFGWFAPSAANFRTLQFRGHCTDDAGSNLVLKVEYFFEFTIKTARPEIYPALGINKLSRDTNLVFGLSHAAIQQITHAKLAPDLFHIHSSALVSETRIACDHKQPVKAREGHCNVLDNAVGKVILLWIGA